LEYPTSIDLFTEMLEDATFGHLGDVEMEDEDTEPEEQTKEVEDEDTER
jgi:hypothetical protein